MALRAWEDYMFVLQVNEECQGGFPRGPARHWSEFRDYLLRYRQGERFDKERFIPDAESSDLRNVNTPALLASWIAYSKRVFRLSVDMQAKLQAIKLGNVRVEDLILPFPAFGIQLETPFTGNDGKMYSFILVNNFHELLLPEATVGTKMTSITAFADLLLGYEALNHRDKKDVLEDISKGKMDRAKRMTSKLSNKLVESIEKVGNLGNDSLVIPLNKDLLAEDFLNDLAKAGTDPRFLLEIRIFFNLCLYLQSLPAEAEKEEGVKWQTEVSDSLIGVRPVITSETEVCDIVGRHIIDSMVVDRRQKTSVHVGWEISAPHWRRAHKRRPPGLGHDPTAEKTVKVRHTLVREDLMPEVGVVKGSVSDLKN